VPRRADYVTIGLAVVIHAGVGLAVARATHAPRPRPKPVLLEFARRPEPPPTPEAKPAAPAPKSLAARPAVTRKVAMRPRTVASSPAPAPAAAPSAAPPAPAAAPVYAVAMASPNATGPAVSTTGGAPGGTGHGTAPAAAAASGTGDGFRPASARDVGSMPEVDADACGRAAVYPKEAEQSGVEGDVRLRVALNESGQVHAVRVLSGLGQGLDAAAIDAIKHRCKFKPAISREGQPVAFVIESYTFHFELPR
jgi:TonB family protein